MMEFFHRIKKRDILKGFVFDYEGETYFLVKKSEIFIFLVK
jgi:hypothetical protein